MQKLKGYKTFIFGLIVALLPLLDYVNQSDIFSDFMSDPNHRKLATFILGAMIIFFRSITNTPAFQSSENADDKLPATDTANGDK